MQLKYLIIEDEVNVANGIVERMNQYKQWQYVGNTATIPFSIEQIELHKPHFIFLDWKLKGGSGYEILDYIIAQKNYHPFILFMTAQVENQFELMGEIIRKYKIVDEFIPKPIWLHLTNNLNKYIEQANIKASVKISNEVFIEDVDKVKYKLDCKNISCIVIHSNSRYKEIYLVNEHSPIIVNWTWQECVAFLEKQIINYFITNKRKHIVVKVHILKFENPTIRINNYKGGKIEIVDDCIKEFEDWLVQ